MGIEPEVNLKASKQANKKNGGRKQKIDDEFVDKNFNSGDIKLCFGIACKSAKTPTVKVDEKKMQKNQSQKPVSDKTRPSEEEPVPEKISSPKIINKIKAPIPTPTQAVATKPTTTTTTTTTTKKTTYSPIVAKLERMKPVVKMAIWQDE